MHMADALLSPAVGATMWTATAATTVYCAKKIREEADPARVPLMGVTGAFVFSAQMLNFTIPATGSSGHLGGGLLLAILLGPHAAFLVMASVLTVQALFFADGGLLALGANIFNLGVFPAFIAYPFVYRRIVGDAPTTARIATGSIAGALVGLILGALAVVLQTVFSGVSALPFGAFAALMLPIHVAIGLVEGVVTAAVVVFVYKTQPEILAGSRTSTAPHPARLKGVLAALLVATVLSGAVFSWFASSNPDGLEWSIAGVTGAPEVESEGGSVHGGAAGLQELTSFLPDYGFASSGAEEGSAEAAGEQAAWPAVDAGTSVAGLVGGAITLAVAGIVGWALARRARRQDAASGGQGS